MGIIKSKYQGVESMAPGPRSVKNISFHFHWRYNLDKIWHTISGYLGKGKGRLIQVPWQAIHMGKRHIQDRRMVREKNIIGLDCI